MNATVLLVRNIVVHDGSASIVSFFLFFRPFLYKSFLPFFDGILLKKIFLSSKNSDLDAMPVLHVLRR